MGDLPIGLWPHNEHKGAHNGLDERTIGRHGVGTAWRGEARHRRQPRAVYPRVRRERDRVYAAGQRPGHGARPDDARLRRRLGGTWQRQRRSGDGGRARPRCRASGRPRLHAAPRVAQQAGRAGLLLWLLQRGPLAALSRGLHPAAVSFQRLASNTATSTASLPRPCSTRWTTVRPSCSCKIIILHCFREC